MALAPGTKFGPYEIVSAIGAGSMGEVYRAKDSRLGRDRWIGCEASQWLENGKGTGFSRAASILELCAL